MKINILALFLLFSTSIATSQPFETFHDFTALKINGDTLHLSDLAGKKVLVVNTASYCTFTPQLGPLQQLYQQYGGNDFTILGFPCNDFGGQEPNSNGFIDSEFTSLFGITFQMMAKISITATDTAEVYKWLQLQSRNGVMDAPVLWNFQKFLIDEAGHLHGYALSAVSPLDTVITNWINLPSVLNFASHNDVINSAKILSNPVSDKLQLDIEVVKPVYVNAKLFSVDGKFVETLLDETVESTTSIFYSTSKIPNGIYYMKLIAGTETKTLKVCVSK